MTLPPWTFEPAVVALLVVSGAAYGIGVRRLWKSSHLGAGISRGECASFAAGWTVFVLALMSPLHELGESLFSAHMAQHELLIGLASPLLVLGRPFVAFVWAVPKTLRPATGTVTRASAISATWGFITSPLTAFLLHAISLWVWHAPAFYQATLTSEWIHAAQHTTFIFTGCLFWWSILSARGERVGRGRGVAIAYLFATILVTSALGALLTFAGTLWYPAYATTTSVWGLTPLEDQQLGGLIMWIPGAFPYVIAALVLFSGWLRESEVRRFVHATRASL